MDAAFLVLKFAKITAPIIRNIVLVTRCCAEKRCNYKQLRVFQIWH